MMVPFIAWNLILSTIKLFSVELIFMVKTYHVSNNYWRQPVQPYSSITCPKRASWAFPSGLAPRYCSRAPIHMQMFDKTCGNIISLRRQERVSAYRQVPWVSALTAPDRNRSLLSPILINVFAQALPMSGEGQPMQRLILGFFAMWSWERVGTLVHDCIFMSDAASKSQFSQNEDH